MNVNVNRLTERIKMSEFKQKDTVIVTSNNGVTKELTIGKEYIVQGTGQGEIMISCDIGKLAWYYSSRFKLKEDNVVNEVEKELYQSNSDGRVYEVVFKGNYCVVLKNTMTGDESFCTVEQLSVYFHTYTKEYAKQQKKNEDLGVLANVTDEIRKLLDDNHVICHTTVNRDTKGLVEFSLMLGESV